MRSFDLPPGYTLVSLRERGDAFKHGLEIAADAGAGTLIWVGRYDLIEFAVVLEPDEPLVTARRAFFAGMNAVADAIAAHAPPEREVSFVWPDAIMFDQQLLGGARLGWPRDCAEDEVPAWLVFGVMLRAADLAQVEAAALSGEVSLMGAGFEMVNTEAMIGSFARHLMAGFDQWADGGFDPIAGNYLARLTGSGIPGALRVDRNGDLLTKVGDSTPPIRTSLSKALSRSAWYDPERGGPGAGVTQQC
ncbi:MAG: biotin/lipoate--protein ligase family protein [Bradyrhizobium sp.]